jgi:hypothetical protein
MQSVDKSLLTQLLRKVFDEQGMTAGARREVLIPAIHKLLSQIRGH